MNTKDWEGLKAGDLVMHKHFGLCEVVDFCHWMVCPSDPIITPKTDAGLIALLRVSGGIDRMLETSKRLLQKVDTLTQ